MRAEFEPSVGVLAIDAAPEERQTFIAKTYAHLAGAIFATVALDAGYFVSGLAEPMVGLLTASWLLTLALFMGAGMLANYWAIRATSPAMALAGLSLYVLAASVLLVPMLAYAAAVAGPQAIPAAALVTLSVFGALTAYAFVTRQDFTFVGGALALGSGVALALVIGSVIFGLNLGLWFSVGMVALAGGYVLRDTSRMMSVYRTDQYDAAALSLYASIALMFWYVLRIFSRR